MCDLCRCYERATELQNRVLDDHDLSDAAKLMFCRLMLSCACGWGYARNWTTDQVKLLHALEDREYIKIQCNSQVDCTVFLRLEKRDKNEEKNAKQ